MARNGRNKRYRRRRSSHGGFVLSLLLCFVLTPAAVIVAVTVFFKVSAVTVIGDTRYADSAIIEASGIEKGGNMFAFNKFKSKDAIFAEMPYLDEIVIRRRLPDNIEISVTECEPAASVESGGEWYLMDMNGKLLEKNAYFPFEGYVKITGAELDSPEIGKYAKFFDEEKQKPLFLVLNTAKNNDILPYVDDIKLDKLYSIRFLYKGRLTVNIGTTDQIDKKFRYMLIIADERLSENDVGTIDVSDGTKARFIPQK